MTSRVTEKAKNSKGKEERLVNGRKMYLGWSKPAGMGRVGHGVPDSLQGAQEVSQLFLHQLRAGGKEIS